MSEGSQWRAASTAAADTPFYCGLLTIQIYKKPHYLFWATGSRYNYGGQLKDSRRKQKFHSVLFVNCTGEIPHKPPKMTGLTRKTPETPKRNTRITLLLRYLRFRSEGVFHILFKL